MFNLGVFVQSLTKKVALLIVAFLTQGTVGEWLLKLGITLDATQLSVGLFGLYEGLRMWMTHQTWWAKLPSWIQAIF